MNHGTSKHNLSQSCMKSYKRRSSWKRSRAWNYLSERETSYRQTHFTAQPISCPPIIIMIDNHVRLTHTYIMFYASVTAPSHSVDMAMQKPDETESISTLPMHTRVDNMPLQGANGGEKARYQLVCNSKDSRQTHLHAVTCRLHLSWHCVRKPHTGASLSISISSSQSTLTTHVRLSPALWND
jgi:hypothetical protein